MPAFLVVVSQSDVEPVGAEGGSDAHTKMKGKLIRGIFSLLTFSANHVHSGVWVAAVLPVSHSIHTFLGSVCTLDIVIARTNIITLGDSPSPNSIEQTVRS